MKKLLALILAAMMLLGALTACASEPAAPANTDAPAATDTPAEAPADEPEAPAEEPADEPEAPAETPVEEPAEDAEILEAGEAQEVTLGVVELPLVDELTTLTAWRSYDAYGEWTDFNDSEWRKAVAAETNVDVEFTTATSDTANEKFGLMLVSMDYTDLMMVPSLAALKSGDAAIEDEILIDLRDYDESLYPNYQALSTANKNVYRDTRTDSGAMWGFFTLMKEPEGPWTGLAYRTDLAEKAGYIGGAPVTIADWEVLLQAYVDGGVEVPFVLPQSGYCLYSPFISAYDTYAGYYAVDGTEVKYGYIDEGFKSYLQLMKDWREKGYIAKNFVDWDLDHGAASAYGMLYDAAYWDDTVGAGMSTFSFNKNMMYSSYGFSQNPDYYRQAVAAPVLEEGQTLHTGFNYTYVSGYPLCISTACEDVELAIRFCDFFYTDKGFLYSNYGVEGVTYNLDENGNPVSTDVLLESEWEYTNHKLATWCWRIGLYTYLQSKEDFADPTIYECYDIWESNNDAAWMIPSNISMTVEESEEYASRNNDITTYVEEHLVRFILGDLNLESDWDNFVKGVQDMGIEDLCDIQEAALTRYNAR